MSEKTIPPAADESLPAPTKGLDYTPPPASSRLRRWVRDTFSREQIVSGLKQLAWVAPLTVLIWVWAEREQQIDVRDVRFPVEVRSSNPRTTVRLREPSDGFVSVDLRGPRNRVDELRGELGRSAPVTFEVPPDRKEGEHQFPVTLVTNRDARFDGVSITGSMPTLITVLVDPIDEETIPVKLRPEDEALFAQPVFNPAKVKVRIPRKLKEQAMLRGNGEVVAYADLSSVADRTPGRKSDVSGVRLVVPHADGDEVEIEPATVSASFTVRERARTLPLKEVPVLQTLPNRLAEQIESIKYDPLVLFNVRVVGPPEAIKQVEDAAGANVIAQVMIDSEDVDAGPRKKEVRFSLPDGVKVHPDDAKQTVELTVISRRASGQ